MKGATTTGGGYPRYGGLPLQKAPERQRVRRDHPPTSSPAVPIMIIFATQPHPRVPPNHSHNAGRGIKLKRQKSWTRRFFKPAIAIQTFVQVYGPFDAVSPSHCIRIYQHWSVRTLCFPDDGVFHGLDSTAPKRLPTLRSTFHNVPSSLAHYSRALNHQYKEIYACCQYTLYGLSRAARGILRRV